MMILCIIFAIISITAGDVAPKCKNKVLDVYFVVDKSASISARQLHQEKEAIKGIIHSFELGPSHTRVGDVVFSNDTEHVFSLGDYNAHSDYIDVNVVPRPIRKVGTNTHLGIEAALVYLAEEGRDDVPHLIVVITDGKSTAPGSLKVTTRRLHKKYDVTVIAVGVGRGADFQELDQIASGTDGDNVILVSSFHELGDMGKTFAEMICEASEKPKNRATCPSLCLKHGYVNGIGKAGETATLTCEDGHTLNGVTSSTCLDDGTWSDDLPICMRKCPTKVGIPFGSMEYLDEKRNAVGGLVKFACDENNELRGSEVLECNSKGRWNGSEPKCLYAQCKTFERFPKGRVSQDTRRGGQANFTCNLGYILQGAATLTCGNNNKWDNPTPKCVKVVLCKTRTYFPNGRASHSGYVHVGETVTFTCLPGYTLEGNATLTCRSDRLFDSDWPRCLTIRCHWIPYLRNGVIERIGIDPVQQMRMSCHTGFILEGNSTINCTNRRWDSIIPKCVPTIQCPPIRYIHNGYALNYTRKPGNSIQVACNEGYQPNTPSGVISCQDDGSWSATLPRCVRNKAVKKRALTCPRIVDLVNGYCIGSNSIKGKVKCFCKTGYTLTGNKILQCMPTKQWSIPFKDDRFPKCIYNQCKPIRGIVHGTSVYREDKLGGTIRFSCREGYKLRGVKIMRCRRGKWSTQKLPVCQETRCPNLIGISFGNVSHISTGDTHGSIRGFSCAYGYRLVGKSQIKCFWRRWKPSVPRCIAEPVCQPLEKIKYGQVKVSAFWVGSRLKLSCDAGYRLSGPSRLICLPSKQWSEKGYCQPHLCPHITSVPKAEAINYRNTAGSKVEFKCVDGSRRKGKKVIVCLKDGTWNDSPPVCEAKTTCPKICMQKGGVFYEGRTKGRIVRFWCSTGFIPIGNPMLECLPSGQWSGDPPVCESLIPSECATKKMDLFFIVEASYAHLREKISYAIMQIASHLKISNAHTRIGVISYDVDARIEIPLTGDGEIFDFSTTSLLSSAPRTKGRNLYKALELLTDSTVTKSSANQMAAVLLTQDHIRSIDKIDYFLNQLSTNGVPLFTIGVGPKPQREHLEMISSGEKSANLFNFTKWSQLMDVMQSWQIAKAVCKMDPSAVSARLNTNSIPAEPLDACKGKTLDVYFVVDTSESIGEPEFIAEENTIRFLVSNFDIGPAKTRIGIITYNRYVFQEFHLDDYDSRESLLGLDALIHRPVDLKAGTRTDLAMTQMMINFQVEGDGRRRIGILLTDGKSRGAFIENVARALEQTNIKRISIGLGRKADLQELNILATGSDGKYVIMASDFYSLKKRHSEIARLTCE